jgi:Protein kinase domain/FtsH Extracellular
VDGLQVGDPGQIGSFRLLGRLGEGGMGRVFLGESPGGRKVAVKVVHPHYANDPEFRQRFAREVATARQVGGFHTAAVVDADPDADPPWMATAYIDGPSLADAVAQRGPLGEAAARELGAALAEGLAAIHDCGLIHRDLKPGNVILADDGPRIIDFGIAKGADATALTGSGAVVGTLRYMSPEQLQGHELTPQSDVFALGAVLAYSATGHDPFTAPTIPAVITRILTSPPDLGPLTGDLRDVIAACLAKDPGSRPSPAALLTRFNRPVPHDPTIAAAPAPVPAAGPGLTAVPPLGPRPADAGGPGHGAAQELSPASTVNVSAAVPAYRTGPPAAQEEPPPGRKPPRRSSHPAGQHTPSAPGPGGKAQLAWRPRRLHGITLAAAVLAVAAVAAFVLTSSPSPPPTLAYSQFLTDVSAHKVKTVELALSAGRTSTGTLESGTSYTVVVPPQAGQSLLDDLYSNGVQVSAPSASGSTAALTYSQFLTDVSAHKVKTVDLAPSAGGMTSGTLANGVGFTVVIPAQASQASLTELLNSDGVQVTGAGSPGQ